MALSLCGLKTVSTTISYTISMNYAMVANPNSGPAVESRTGAVALPRLANRWKSPTSATTVTATMKATPRITYIVDLKGRSREVALSLYLNLATAMFAVYRIGLVQGEAASVAFVLDFWRPENRLR